MRFIVAGFILIGYTIVSIVSDFVHFLTFIMSQGTISVMVMCILALIILQLKMKLDDSKKSQPKKEQDQVKQAIDLEDMQRTYRMITSLVILGNNYQECDDLNDHVSQTLKMARKYDLKIIPNTKICHLTALLRQILDSRVLSHASQEKEEKLVKQINQSISTLNKEWNKLYLSTKEKANAIQDAKDQKHLLTGEIEKLSDDAKIDYYEKLSKKLNDEDNKEDKN